MHEALGRLIQGSVDVPESGSANGLPDTARGRELAEFLSWRNGILSPDSALWIRGCGTSRYGLSEWNSSKGWRAGYGSVIDGLFFFAEDAFGCQWCLGADSVMSFDPETAEIVEFAASLGEWAERVIGDYDSLTGAWVTRQWQAANGPLPYGTRMIPAIPFVLGGLFDLTNVRPIDCWDGAESRADIWNQIKDLPDGATVKWKVID